MAPTGRPLSAASPLQLVISCGWDTGGDGHRRIMAKHRVGVETLFLGNFGTTVFVVPDVRWGLKPFYHTLQPVILSQSRYSPSTGCHYLHLLEMGGHVRLPSCVLHASIVLSKHLVGVEPLFCLVFWDHGCACAGGGGLHSTRTSILQDLWVFGLQSIILLLRRTIHS